MLSLSSEKARAAELDQDCKYSSYIACITSQKLYETNEERLYYSQFFDYLNLDAIIVAPYAKMHEYKTYFDYIYMYLFQ